MPNCHKRRNPQLPDFGNYQFPPFPLCFKGLALMRIQYLSASGGLGGAEVCFLDMMASLQKEKRDWKLALIAAQDGPLVQKAAALAVSTDLLPFPPAAPNPRNSTPS